MLAHSAEPLSSVHDLAMLDLDGVVYIGGRAVPGAARHIATATAAGLRCAFITNNASRTPATVAEHLVELGVPARAEDVVTSAQAAARLLADRLGAGGVVALLGGAGLRTALLELGLQPVGVDDERAQALVSGYGPDVLWREVMRAASRVRDGLWWVASNTDYTFPTDFGIAPGHGMLVRAIADFAGVQPDVAGKPSRPLLDETVRRVGGRRPLMVGDRVDTDIGGAVNAGVDSLLVLTGVTGVAELVAIRASSRPTYLSVDLAGLTGPHPPVRAEDEGWVCGGWYARVVDGGLEVRGAGQADDWWRALAAAAWSHLDRTGSVAGTGSVGVPPTDVGVSGR